MQEYFYINLLLSFYFRFIFLFSFMFSLVSILIFMFWEVESKGSLCFHSILDYILIILATVIFLGVFFFMDHLYVFLIFILMFNPKVFEIFQ